MVNTSIFKIIKNLSEIGKIFSIYIDSFSILVYYFSMSMDILYVGKHDVTQWISELNEFIKAQDKTINIICETSIDEAYNHLFSQKVGVIIVDSELEGQSVKDFITTVKNEVVLHHISVLVIVPHYEKEQLHELLLIGADRIVPLDRLDETTFFLSVKPLLFNALVMFEKIHRTTHLQDKAITDFIMLDLIKDYIPKTIWEVAQKCAHLQVLSLPGEEKEATVVFGDIVGFTKMSENLSPKEVIAILNEAYEVITRYVYDHNGDIDKFIGDAFFAVFQSPSDAVNCMVQIQKELEKINEIKRSQEVDEIQFRISIHTGPVIRGNVGGNRRYDNTLIGDTVNTASRLEHLCPNGDIVISDKTRKEIGLTISKENKFTAQLRGKDTKITYYTIFELLKNHKDY